MGQMSESQMDAFAVAFTIFASIWLILAVFYMVTVCLYFRMRARGHLRGSMSDPAWGRVYFCSPWPCCGRHNHNREHGGYYYIPMGWIFRRYVMFQRTGEERARIAKIRVMSVQERRAAVQEILRNGIGSDCNNGSSVGKEQNPPEISIHAAADGDRDLPADCSVKVDDVEAPPEMVLKTQQGENGSAHNTGGDDDNDNDTTTTTKSTLHNHSSCPICFGPYTTQDPAFCSSRCSHCFHWECILSWLEFHSHRDCPCCRVELVAEENIWKIVQRQRRQERYQKLLLRKKRLCHNLNANNSSSNNNSNSNSNNDNNNNANNNNVTTSRRIQRGATEDKEDVESAAGSTTQQAHSHSMDHASEDNNTMTMVIHIPMGGGGNDDDAKNQQQHNQQDVTIMSEISSIELDAMSLSSSLSAAAPGHLRLEPIMVGYFDDVGYVDEDDRDIESHQSDAQGSSFEISVTNDNNDDDGDDGAGNDEDNNNPGLGARPQDVMRTIQPGQDATKDDGNHPPHDEYDEDYYYDSNLEVIVWQEEEGGSSTPLEEPQNATPLSPPSSSSSSGAAAGGKAWSLLNSRGGNRNPLGIDMVSRFLASGRFTEANS